MYSSIRSPYRAIVILVLILSTAACGSSPTAASAAPTTDTLTGTLSAGNVVAQSLNASAGGNVTITLTALTPAVTGVGLGIGAVANGSCSLQYTASPVSQGAVWSTSLSGAGTFCVVIYDIGYLTQDESYTITVVHP